jgi:hypothetical protein
MTREEAKTMLPIIQAYIEGKQIQQLSNKWKDVNELSINCLLNNPELYRIKPEPKYRSFKNAEECWTEMQKHQPFGWVKDKKDGYYVLITAVDNGDYMSLSGNSGWSFYSLMKDYTFTDDIPFGIKVE